MLYAVIFFAIAGSALLLIARAYRGPSASKTLKRRVEMIKERHGDVIAGHAQAQIRKLFAQRASRIEGVFSTLIPKPALLRRRLEMTGKDISLAKYALICIGIAAFSFLVDFDAADQMIRAGAPERAAWGIALGLTVTLVWLYIEILRLLSYFQND